MPLRAGGVSGVASSNQIADGIVGKKEISPPSGRDPPVPVSLLKTVAPPTQHAVPTMAPMDASRPRDYGSIEDQDRLLRQVGIRLLEESLHKAGLPYQPNGETKQAIREIQRMPDMNFQAKIDGRYRSNYKIRTHVKKNSFHPSCTQGFSTAGITQYATGI